MGTISDLETRIERLAASELQSRIATRAASAVHLACIAGFNQQRDPYGEAWAPRKDRRGTWPILDKQGPGAAILTLAARAIGDRVVLTIRGYMKYHETGTSRMVARMIFPSPTRGLGLWAEPVSLAASQSVRELAS